MARNYKNFIDAYVEYHKDQFIPEKFVKWTAISIMAGALERKVWLPWSRSLSIYPNLYILLVAHPAIGKSSAIMPGIKMLREINMEFNSMKFIPSQVTEAKLIEMMRHPSIFEYKNAAQKQCAGFYYASEASACLKDLYGGFVSTITAFYDCDPVWEKATVGMKDETYLLVNVCFNLIAGCTFDYLGKLITKDNIMGGFASRLNYVVQNEVITRSSPWQNRGIEKSEAVDYDLLKADLIDIHQLVGPFRGDSDYQEKWEAWFPTFDLGRQNMESENHQALLARKHTNLLKLSMILSVAESSDRIVKGHHFDEAMAMTDELEEQLPNMLRSGESKEVNTQKGLNAAIFKALLAQPDKSMPYQSLKQKLMYSGFKANDIQSTTDVFRQSNSTITFDGINIRLVGNPNKYL